MINTKEEGVKVMAMVSMIMAEAFIVIFTMMIVDMAITTGIKMW